MFKNKAYMKMLMSTMLGALIILSSMFMVNQNRKIDKLEEELYLKQQNEQRASDHYESLLNIKTIDNHKITGLKAIKIGFADVISFLVYASKTFGKV